MSRERTAYFEELSALLRERDMPPARVDALVRELAAYAVEARSPLVEEFGPAGELADRLTDRQSADAADGPESRGGDLGVDRRRAPGGATAGTVRWPGVGGGTPRPPRPLRLPPRPAAPPAMGLPPRGGRAARA
ncbi:hypothetical protein Sdia_60670 [Streptomyces diastaticus subsp. diastaticus]|uniref:Uncharacterized protein n=1 Tax=Streptomyces diastaticus subsp. diastaticus TaxID=68040 RepID=A0ABQ1CYB7_STRDI|nr:hypothetical protein Sdia_60670 [Streptomyces diastaticus subsp. diastaticus]